MTHTGNGPLRGLRVIELASYVAGPLGGLTLSQLGADVLRVDPLGGTPDRHRWPLAPSGASLYWTGLNRGKRSIALDLRTAPGRQLLAELVADAGTVLTNAGSRPGQRYEDLRAVRDDLIYVEVAGARGGRGSVDYTADAAAGFPLATGTSETSEPTVHVLPAWDVACGLYAALSITAAVRQRDSTGHGTQITLPRRRRIGHRGNPRLPHRSPSERSQSRVRRQRRLRHVRPRVRHPRRPHDDRGADRPALERPAPRPASASPPGRSRRRSASTSPARRSGSAINACSTPCCSRGSPRGSPPRPKRRCAPRPCCGRGSARSARSSPTAATSCWPGRSSTCSTSPASGRTWPPAPPSPVAAHPRRPAPGTRPRRTHPRGAHPARPHPSRHRSTHRLGHRRLTGHTTRRSTDGRRRHLRAAPHPGRPLRRRVPTCPPPSWPRRSIARPGRAHRDRRGGRSTTSSSASATPTVRRRRSAGSPRSTRACRSRCPGCRSTGAAAPGLQAVIDAAMQVQTGAATSCSPAARRA